MYSRQLVKYGQFIINEFLHLFDKFPNSVFRCDRWAAYIINQLKCVISDTFFHVFLFLSKQ